MSNTTLTVVVNPASTELGVVTDTYTEGNKTVYVVNDDWEVTSNFVTDEGNYIVCFAAF